MFPPAGAEIYYNEAGEPTGWDMPGYDDGPDPGEYYDRMDHLDHADTRDYGDDDDYDYDKDEDEADDQADDQAESHLPHNPVTDRDETGGDEVEMAEEGPEPDEPDSDQEGWYEHGQAEAYADAEMARFDDDPNPYHGDYSEM